MTYEPTRAEDWRVALGLEKCYVSDSAERILAAVVDRAGSCPISCRFLAHELFGADNSEADTTLTHFGLRRELRLAILTLSYEGAARVIPNSAATGPVPSTASLRRVLARSMNNGSISTGGLLIGLLAEDCTRLARLCAVMGLTAESASADLIRARSVRQ